MSRSSPVRQAARPRKRSALGTRGHERNRLSPLPRTPGDLSDHPAVAAWAKSAILPVSRVGRQDLWARGKCRRPIVGLQMRRKTLVASSCFRAFGRIPPAFAHERIPELGADRAEKGTQLESITSCVLASGKLWE